MFSRRIPLADLIDLCRILRHQLGAGLGIHDVLKKQGERGRRSVRAIAARISVELQQGSSLTDALQKEGDAFPLLFRSLVKLGESTGHLAEIFGELERYYQLELQLRRQFRSQIFLPVVQFFFAVAIIAGIIWLMGFLADMNRVRPLVTFFGLKGTAGSLAFLGVVFGALALVWIFYRIIASVGHQKAWMHRLLLSLPALGPCLRDIAMSRFTLALQLTLDSGLPIAKGLRLSLEATGNAYFAAHADGITASLKKGTSLHESLDASRLFDREFLDMVESSEAAGSVPEMMKHLAAQYQEDAGRRMSTLTRLAGGAIWCAVAGFIIWGIFKLASIYFGMFEAIRG